MSGGTKDENAIVDVEYTRTDLAQMKIENDSIIAMCQLRPRKFADIKNALTEQLDTFPDLADKSVYEKPVGQDGNGKQKTVVGLSVRAAESLAELYGFNRIRSDVTPLDDDTVKVEATFTDYQNGRVWQDGGIVSKFYKDRNGKRVRYSDDRFYNVVVKAEASKRIREVILRSVNAALKEWFYVECCKRIDALLDDSKVAEMVKKFATIGVTDKHLENFIGRPSSMGWTVDDRRKLLGVWNAIRDGESTVAEVFAEQPKPVASSMDELTKQMEKEKTADKPATEKPKDEKKPDPKSSMAETATLFSKFKYDLALLDMLKAVDELYDKAFGPDSTIEWTPEQNNEAAELVRLRKEAISASRKK